MTKDERIAELMKCYSCGETISHDGERFECYCNNCEPFGLQDKVKELEGLLSRDTSEFKSAAFQKIKELEAEVERLKNEPSLMGDYNRLEKNYKTLESALVVMKAALKEVYDMHTEGDPKPIWVIDVAKTALAEAAWIMGGV